MSLLQRQLLGNGPETYPSYSSVSYVACHLARHDILQQHAWGLWVSFVGKKESPSLVVQGATPTFHSLLQWTWVTASSPDTAIITNQSYGSNLWMSYVAMLPRVTHPSHGTLLSGDIILTINGMPVSSFGGSLSHVTDYLRRCNQLFLVAVRSENRSVRRGAPHASPEHLALEKAHSYAPPTRTYTRDLAPPTYPYPRNAYPTTTARGCATTQCPPRELLRVVSPSKPEKSTAPTESRHKSPSKKVYKAACTKPGAMKGIPQLPIKVAVEKKDRKVMDIVASFSLPTKWTNPMFKNNDGIDDDGKSDDDCALPYCDNVTFDPYDGSRSAKFLFPINTWNWDAWLKHRKWKWRSRWKVTTIEAKENGMDPQWTSSGLWTNPMFLLRDKSNEKEDSDNSNGTAAKELPYDDNFAYEYPEDCHSQFLAPVCATNWSTWLNYRMKKWRTKWKPYQIQADDDELYSHQNSMSERLESSICYEFWNDRHSSFDGWLKASKDKWKKTYSWNTRKRKRIQQVCEEVVHFPSAQDPIAAQQELESWLRVRKNQWRMLRRKRQRRLKGKATNENPGDTNLNPDGHGIDDGQSQHSTKKSLTAVSGSGDYQHIDALLEEEERQRKTLAIQKKCRQPLDLSFLFLPSLGISDDIAAHIVDFLDCSEHGKLLCINKSFGEGLKSRAYMWQLLCHRCPHWHLPRRPRKPWYKLYLSKLQTEVFASRKQWDDLLTQVYDVLFRKGDQLKLVKKLIGDAQKKFNFTVDYVSGVVCERNSILNLAVINKRHKVVHWLVEQKNADIETSDRGHFTPLINAAWGGDKRLVRFFLSRGADRNKVGTGHYTEALAHSDFKGLTAEGWARKKGHNEIAELIRVGL